MCVYRQITNISICSAWITLYTFATPNTSTGFLLTTTTTSARPGVQNFRTYFTRPLLFWLYVLTCLSQAPVPIIGLSSPSVYRFLIQTDSLHDKQADDILPATKIGVAVRRDSTQSFSAAEQQTHVVKCRHSATVCLPKFLTVYRQWRYIEIRYNTEFLCRLPRRYSQVLTVLREVNACDLKTAEEVGLAFERPQRV
jgi:hypothetical protein